MSSIDKVSANKRLSFKFLQKKISPDKGCQIKPLLKDDDTISNKVISEIKNIMIIQESNGMKKREEFFHNFPENPFDMEKIKRITRETVKLMKQISGFNQFMKFNHIDEESVRLALKYSSHYTSIKGTYIFRQGDRSKKFYCILNGRISIRVAKKPKFSSKEEEDRLRKGKLKRTKTKSSSVDPHTSSLMFNSKSWLFKLILDEEEEERIVLESGMCFGERGLIYDLERNASAYCLEDTDLLVLNKDIFLYAFGRQIIKSETDRKTFICRVIPYMSEIPRLKFNELFQRVTTRFFQKDQIIYNENMLGERFYIIYQGECMLEKKIRGKLDRLSLVRMSVGDISGLEILFNSKGHYDYTLKCLVDNTIVIILNREIFSEFLSPILINLKTIHKIKEEYYSKIIEKKKEVVHKVNFSFDKNNRSCSNEDNLVEKERLYQKKVQNLIKEINTENEEKKKKNNLEKKQACSVSVNSNYIPEVDPKNVKALENIKTPQLSPFKLSKSMKEQKNGINQSVDLNKIEQKVEGNNRKMLRVISCDQVMRKNKSDKSNNSLTSLKKAVFSPASQFYNSGKFYLPLVSKLSENNIVI